MTGILHSRAQDVAEALAELSRGARTGERLGQKAELREQVGGSVGSFNEGLKLAEARGVVTVRRGPHGGVFAAEPNMLRRLGDALLTLDVSDPSVRDAFRIRNSLDPLLITDALENATLADIDVLRGFERAMDRAIARWDLDAFLGGMLGYQRHMLSLSPNVMLRALLGAVFDFLELQAVPVSTGGELSEPGLRARLALFTRMTEALGRRDLAAAYEVMAEAAVGWTPYRGDGSPDPAPVVDASD